MAKLCPLPSSIVVSGPTHQQCRDLYGGVAGGQLHRTLRGKLTDLRTDMND